MNHTFRERFGAELAKKWSCIIVETSRECCVPGLRFCIHGCWLYASDFMATDMISAGLRFLLVRFHAIANDLGGEKSMLKCKVTVSGLGCLLRMPRRSLSTRLLLSSLLYNKISELLSCFAHLPFPGSERSANCHIELSEHEDSVVAKPSSPLTPLSPSLAFCSFSEL